MKALSAASLVAAAGPLSASPSPAARRHLVAGLEAWKLPVNHRGDWLVLRLRTESGLTGIGDASHGGTDAKTVAYLRRFAELLRGRSIFEVEAFRQAVAPILAQEPGASAIVAASALEHCLWDLMGKALGVPTHDLLGGAVHARIPLYANINRSTLPRTADAFAAMAARAVGEGFSAVKLAPFDEMPADVSRTNDVTPLIDQGVARAEAVRAAIGPKRRLLLDAHSRFTGAEGLALASRLEPLDLYWLEEVTPAEPIEPLAAINRAARMPTAGGESVRGVAGSYPYIRAGAVDIVMPDVKICGGMLELKKIAALAEAAGLAVSPHGPASPVGNLAAAQVAATLPNFTILEHSFGEVPWRAELITPFETLDRGAMVLATAPGFGAALNPQALAKYGSPI
ncbi:mandelate racemase/muconate lactonizing enzyme family protein [Sphingomonas sp.]|uniref:mandelate racemase/muconate lactonizing enzyme family protein n=1 Tax=Sphingomonas sp. TaxID=28214 RepID=UPI001B138E00|nr:mandelate racemase/muconate lactonizing enzyme family protein [Sphingomonas sp.]MBO9712388.1 mandelate racemase/muconate lactonizing enzyme family protein [Sphingomonas sp.]